MSWRRSAACLHFFSLLASRSLFAPGYAAKRRPRTGAALEILKAAYESGWTIAAAKVLGHRRRGSEA